MSSLIDRYQQVRSKIEAAAQANGRDPSKITLIAVSKTHPFESVAALYQAGHRDFGENYAQELADKAKQAQALGMHEIRWHMIGHLQSNKVKAVLPYVFMIHTVDSEKVAAEIQKRAERPVPVLIEVNLDDQDTKSGISAGNVSGLVRYLSQLDRVLCTGLMCIPDPERTGGVKPAFRALRELEASLRPHTSGVLSMGMTADFSDAIAEGATLIRVGTAIFGSRD